MGSSPALNRRERFGSYVGVRTTPVKSYSLFLGARNTGRRGRRFLKSDDTLVQQLTAKHFPDGFTILEAKGGWYDPADRTFKQEEARQILVCTRTPAKLRAWCEELGHALHQDELLVVEEGLARRYVMRRR